MLDSTLYCHCLPLAIVQFSMSLDSPGGALREEFRSGCKELVRGKGVDEEGREIDVNTKGNLARKKSVEENVVHHTN